MVASVIFACWVASSSELLAKLSGVASLTLLDIPREEVEDGGGGGDSGQFTHLLCSASHGSWVWAPAPRLCAFVAIGPSPWQLSHVPQLGALHW